MEMGEALPSPRPPSHISPLGRRGEHGWNISRARGRGVPIDRAVGDRRADGSVIPDPRGGIPPIPFPPALSRSLRGPSAGVPDRCSLGRAGIHQGVMGGKEDEVGFALSRPRRKRE